MPKANENPRRRWVRFYESGGREIIDLYEGHWFPRWARIPRGTRNLCTVDNGTLSTPVVVASEKGELLRELVALARQHFWRWFLLDDTFKAELLLATNVSIAPEELPHMVTILNRRKSNHGST